MRQLNGRDVDPALVFRADGAILVFTLRVKRAFSGNKDAGDGWQLIIYWAFRKYRLIYRLYPPLLGDQIMLPLA